MTPSAQNAFAALRERLHRRGVWAGALAVPGLGIPVMAGFAQPGEGPQILERSLWLLGVLPLAFLSPLPWQWTEGRARLAPWKRALLVNLAGGFAAGILLAVVFLAWAYPLSELGSRLFHRIALVVPVIAALSVGLGWPVAHLERLWIQARNADELARTLGWMQHRSPFPPGLLVCHLRRLSSRAEAEPAMAEEGILRLAHLYRAWLAVSDLPLVTLEAERDLLESYFAAEGHRLGQVVRSTWDGWATRGAPRLPPYCLFPACAALVEAGARAFAFSVEETMGGWTLRLDCADLPPDRRLPSAEIREASARLREAFGEQTRLEWDTPSTLRLCLPRVTP